jgi:HEAT repeat protein
MTRGTWIALLLLIVSNAAWVVGWLEDDDAGERGAPERAALEARVRTLDAEVHRLRAGSGPELHGHEVSPDAMPEVAPDGGAPGGPKPEGAQPPEPLPGAAAGTGAPPKTPEAEALTRVKDILRKIMQVQDAALRDEGLQELRAALASRDPLLVEYALSALHATRVLQIDRSGFRQTVLDLLASPSAGIRRSALYALHATGVADGDTRHALAAAQDPDPIVRAHVLKVLALYGRGPDDPQVAQAAARLLGDENDMVRRGALQGLSGTKLAPAVEQALIALARRPKDRLAAVRDGLSTVKQKSRAVVDALLGYLDDPDVHVRARAHWGLQHDVAKEQQPYVARRYAEHLPSFLNPRSQGEALRVIARHGDASLVPTLEQFADNDLVDPRVRAMTTKVIDLLRAR